MDNNRLMLIAGGTGGHVFPGLTIAHKLIKQGWKVRWLGTIDRIEADLVPKHGIDIEFIRISGLRGKSIKELFYAPINILNACIQARKIIKNWRPNIVLGMGGYVSGPGGLAAWSYGIPLILHEQNSVAGITNKCLSIIATRVMQAFPGVFSRADMVGNPIRPDILSIPLPSQRMINHIGPLRVLVIGGSQGANILNHILPQVAAQLGDSIRLWHQTGKGLQKIVQQAYYSMNCPYHKVTEFIDNMAEVYNWADVVICRSGALTVSEISAVGLPAIFVPFQHKDRQQYWNALPLEKVGAAKIFEQPYFTTSAVVKTLKEWDRSTLLIMANKARQLGIRDSTDQIFQIITQVARTKSK